MILYSDCVFDERIEGPSSGTPSYYTSIDYASDLSKGDLIAIMVVVDDVNTVGTASLTVSFEHSTDGMLWGPKRGTPEIPGLAVTTGITNVYYWSEPRFGNVPSQKYVRFNTSMGNVRSTGPHVQIFATVRDRRGSSQGAPTPDVTYGSAWQNARREAQSAAELKALAPRRALTAFQAARQRFGGNSTAALASLDASTRMELREYMAEVQKRGASR